MDPIPGHLAKLKTRPETPVAYALDLGPATVELNPLLGRRLRLRFTGAIRCVHCGAPTPASYAQGHCFRCSQTLAGCDLCILKPELCHFHRGTCREPAWAQGHCFVEHYVYLANSSGLKVGITRAHQAPTRWMDQGAIQALPIARAKDRVTSGRAEDALRAFVADKTDWRKLLKGEAEPLDLAAARDRLLAQWPTGLEAEPWPDAPVSTFRYPVLAYPDKVKALNLDKEPEVAGTLQGIKGQYLILDTGVLNVRKFAGYRVELAWDA